MIYMDDFRFRSLLKIVVESRFALTVKYTNQKLVPINLSLVKKKRRDIF